MRGVPLRVVQDLLGHASIRQTERYAHLAPDATHASAVATLDLAACQQATNDPSDPIGSSSDSGALPDDGGMLMLSSRNDSGKQ